MGRILPSAAWLGAIIPVGGSGFYRWLVLSLEFPAFITMAEFHLPPISLGKDCALSDQYWFLDDCLCSPSFANKQVIEPAEKQPADSAIDKGI